MKRLFIALSLVGVAGSGAVATWAQPSSPAAPAPETSPAPAPPSPGPAPAASPAIEDGSRVQLEYVLKEESGEVLDSNQGREPLTYVQGRHEIVPGLERALHGMRAGEGKRVTVKPEDGFGQVDPRAEAEVPKDAVPPAALTPGTQLAARTSAGRTHVVRVKEVRDTTVVLDLNHPLAGKTLEFDVRVLGVDPPSR